MNLLDPGIAASQHSGWWIADLVLRGSVLLCAVVVILAMTRHRSAAYRHLIGMIGMLAMPLLPLAMIWLPAGFGVLPSFFASATKVTDPDAIGLATTGLAPLWLLWILGIWATVGMVLGARALAASHRLGGFFNGGRTLARAEASLESTRQKMNLAAVPEIRMSDAVDVPITFGLFTPKILLPSEAAAWDQDRLNWVLLHEQAHIARRDSAAQAAAIAICCLFWWQPLVWYLGRRLDIECEHAADDLVLAHRDDAVGYARLLVDIAESLRGRPLSAFGLSMARPSQLTARLKAMFDNQTDRRRAGPRQALVTMSALGVLLIPLAAMPNDAAGPGSSQNPSTSRITPVERTARGHFASRGHGHRGSGHRARGHSSTSSGHASGDHGGHSHRSGEGHAGHAEAGHSATGHQGTRAAPQ